MPSYLLLLHEPPIGPTDFTPEQMQEIIERYRRWSTGLLESGKMARRGEKLKEEGGRLLARNGSKIEITDGPYAEAKEVITGLFVIDAASYDEAVDLCRDCPHLDFGSIEIREIDPT